MSDRLRPYGSDTLIIPFRIVPSGPANDGQSNGGRAASPPAGSAETDNGGSDGAPSAPPR